MFAVSSHPHRTYGRRLAQVLIALATAVLIGLFVGAAPVGAYGSTRGVVSKPVRVSVVSPSTHDIAGKDGAGFVVDLALTARDKRSNTLLSPEAGYQPFFNNPGAPTFHPGPDPGAPGLVVMLSTTPNTPGTAFQGPRTNLAGLFQINGVASVENGLTRIRSTWQIGKAGFGSGRSVLTVFAVVGTAPAVVPRTGLTVMSNRVHVPFTITSPAVHGNSSEQPAGTASAR